MSEPVSQGRSKAINKRISGLFLRRKKRKKPSSNTWKHNLLFLEEW